MSMILRKSRAGAKVWTYFVGRHSGCLVSVNREEKRRRTMLNELETTGFLTGTFPQIQLAEKLEERSAGISFKTHPDL